jgi:predicted protein tyrosine phosphatase
MAFRRLGLPAGVPGQVWLHAMPGRLESWPEFLRAAQACGLHEVVCLNPLDEVQALSPRYHRTAVIGDLPFRWRHIPMLNFDVGVDENELRQHIVQMAQALARGEHLLIHCAAGIGRTGSVAACLLKQLGEPRDAALQAVRSAGSNPQSAAQSGLIERF